MAKDRRRSKPKQKSKPKPEPVQQSLPHVPPRHDWPSAGPARKASILSVVAGVVWKAIQLGGDVDFLLSFEDRSMGSVFQAITDYGWVALILLGIVLFRYDERHAEATGRTIANWSSLFAIGSVSFILGVLTTIHLINPLQTVVLEWGPTRDKTGCRVEIDSSRLTNFRDDYRILYFCGMHNPTIDMNEDTTAAISHPYQISGFIMELVVPFTDQMRNRLKGNYAFWSRIALVPKEVDAAVLRKLSDVEMVGGRIVNPAR